MADKNEVLSIKDLRSGRNNVDPPQSLSETHCVEALNVDWYNATFARKRNGLTSVSLTSSPFTGKISSGFRHVPGTDETAAELWATDDAATVNIGRLAGGTAWATPTLKDVPTGNGWDFAYASFNGLLYIAYQTAVGRLHCWDPFLTKVRRTGLATTGTPTVANTGGGAYPAVLRYYRTRATEQRSGVTVRRSEPSTSASFTPSGAGTAARVTLVTPPGEDETHWEVEASTDNATFFRIATVVIGTTTYDDSALVATYTSNPVSATTGTYTLQKSYKFIAVDQGRLLGFGSWTSTDPQSRVEFSAVLGSSDVSDGERVPTGNFLGLDENDSGAATALRGPVNGSFFAGKYRQFWKLTPTGNVTVPYSALKLSPVVGPLSQVASVVGEDEIGGAAIYFNTYQGPYRWSTRGIEYLGKPIEDRTIGANNGVSLNLAATKVVSHVLWYPSKRQVFFWLAVSSGNDPSEGVTFSVGRTPPYYGGYATEPGQPSRWSRFTGGMATARCSFLFSNTIGASMSRDLNPYIGSTSANNTFAKADAAATFDDLGIGYISSVTTKVYRPSGIDFTAAIMGGQLVGVVGTSTLTVTSIADWGAQTSGDTVTFFASASETRQQNRIGSIGVGIVVGDVKAMQWTVGDTSGNTAWQLDELAITFAKGTPLVA